MTPSGCRGGSNVSTTQRLRPCWGDPLHLPLTARTRTSVSFKLFWTLHYPQNPLLTFLWTRLSTGNLPEKSCSPFSFILVLPPCTSRPLGILRKSFLVPTTRRKCLLLKRQLLCKPEWSQWQKTNVSFGWGSVLSVRRTKAH